MRVGKEVQPWDDLSRGKGDLKSLQLAPFGYTLLYLDISSCGLRPG